MMKKLSAAALCSAAVLLAAGGKPPAADFSGEWEAVNQGGGSERKLTIVKTGEGYSIQDEFKLDAAAARPSSSSQVAGKAASDGKIQYDKHPDTKLSIDESSGLLTLDSTSEGAQVVFKRSH